jgi:head-tail adaptor
MTKLGDMRHRVEIQAKTETGDGFGGVSYTWNTVATVWADMKHKSLSGAVGPGGQIMDRTQIDFIMRGGCAGEARVGRRIAYCGRVFFIQATANEDERNRFIRVVTVERPVGHES